MGVDLLEDPKEAQAIRSVKTILISTGEELVRGRSMDTNAAYLARELEGLGFEIARQVTVGDEPDLMNAAISRAVEDAEVVIVTGGLGPTADDRTRDAVARALGVDLVEDGDSREALGRRLAEYGRQVDDRQVMQAQFPEGAVIFPNPRGTARGFAAQRDGSWVVAMPGVPAEMVNMFEQSVITFLRERFQRGGVVATESLHLYPIAEPDVDARLRDLAGTDADPLVGITVMDGVVTVTLRVRAATREEAHASLEEYVQEVRGRFGDIVYGSGGATLAGALFRVMQERQVTVGVAESLTGGLIGHMLVSVAGISDAFLADVVAYSNEAKEDLLGVAHQTLVEHGAVSEPVAREMAAGVCRAARSDLGISTTGIAGPTGGTEQKPVGLVYLGICLNGTTRVSRLDVRGDRWRVRDRTAKYALNQARRVLTNGFDCMEAQRAL